MPKLAVIMAVYNNEKTVSLSIESILNQTYKDFTFYICDDGSKDNSYSIIKSYAEKDSRIIPLQNTKNSGLSYSLNKMISLVLETDSKYIARMDGDDISEPERFEKQITFLENHPEISILGASIQFFDSKGFWGKLQYPEIIENKSFLFRSPFAHPTVVYSTEAIKKLELQSQNKTESNHKVFYSEDKKIGRSEDYDLFMRFQANNLKGHNLQDFLLQYREDRAAQNKRKFKYTITEARVRFRGFKSLHLLPKGLIYIIKPIIVGLIPAVLRLKLRKNFFSKEQT